MSISDVFPIILGLAVFIVVCALLVIVSIILTGSLLVIKAFRSKPEKHSASGNRHRDRSYKDDYREDYETRKYQARACHLQKPAPTKITSSAFQDDPGQRTTAWFE